MCEEDNPLRLEFNTIDFAMGTVRELTNMLQNYSATMKQNEIQKVTEALGNMADILLLATARAKSLHSEEE
jgi:hypothetical protein